jgi:uncharacterized protein (TIGR04255 family)
MAKLPNAPLQEVIFEVKWDLDVKEETNQTYDKGFDIAAGKFSGIVQEKFPVVRRKLPEEIPNNFLNYKTVYQYKSGEQTWPILQLGPGIFTVNDTDKNYDWNKTYFPLIQQSINWLEKAYTKNLNYRFASLKYIDTIKVNDYDFKGDWKSFISGNLKVSFQNQFDVEGKLSDVQLNQAFKLEDESHLQVSVSSGKTNKLNEPLLIWQIGIQKLKVFEKTELFKWLNRSHDIASDLFKKIVKPDLYDSFT